MRTTLAVSATALILFAGSAGAQSHRGENGPGLRDDRRAEPRGHAGKGDARSRRPAQRERETGRPERAENRGGPQLVARGALERQARRAAADIAPGGRNGAGGDAAQRARARDFGRTATAGRTSHIRHPRDIEHLPVRSVGLIDGCPPGLAKRAEPCLPPGEARRLIAQRRWYDGWWRSPTGNDRSQYRHAGGYLYRLNPADGAVMSWLPLLGGALAKGRSWPGGYAGDPVPAYHADYYGYSDVESYRYANGVIYGVDPKRQMIQSVAALLTGDEWKIGSPMPAGYGVYNVPNAYRDRYRDTDRSWYRYSDGYVYRIDPTTRLVQAAIELLG
ncbi:hypothetical protein [Stakelama tenebrarum]|uniref:RcnB family protein n=1 Tax=Stakelama tenebrarum TaxID=2711215 RepID=A0A6G6Y6X5_9SPHN|nr:hypothetical protein [Sphingosinithalassobacter tenebrarum]QIG80601.1 hypothetical protein G5C33_12955 [Sphingosinithalassobacter tenebrarum]